MKFKKTRELIRAPIYVASIIFFMHISFPPHSSDDLLIHAISLMGLIRTLYRSGSPIPIEYLPAENTLSSRVRLMILYQGRPTTTIAVGDPLTFRLEAQDG